MTTNTKTRILYFHDLAILAKAGAAPGYSKRSVIVTTADGYWQRFESLTNAIATFELVTGLALSPAHIKAIEARLTFLTNPRQPYPADLDTDHTAA